MKDITVLVTTSYIPSHPSTALMERCYKGIRAVLPEAPIIIGCDGVNSSLSESEAHDYREYLGYLKTASWLDRNTVITMNLNAVHQTGLLGNAFTVCHTPVILFVEHDFELFTDGGIDWADLVEFITNGSANYIKLYGCDRIIPQHEHLMYERIQFGNAYLIRTRQWSTWPHLANVEWYKKMHALYMQKPDSAETALYGIIDAMPRDESKCWIYNPGQGGMARCRHLDGKHWHE
jgi:hypothetical protein